MTALSDRLNEAKGDEGLDTIVDRAHRKGHKIHRSVFANAFNGDHAKRPQDATLRAFADGLGIDVNELRRICKMPEGEMGIYKGPDESARLNRDQRKALDRLIKTIVAQREVVGDGDDLAKKRAQLELDRKKLSEDRAKLDKASLLFRSDKDETSGESEGDAP